MTVKYVEEIMKANKMIDDEIKKLFNHEMFGIPNTIKISTFILKVTSSFGVGERTVNKRINFWVDSRDDVLHLRNGYLVYEPKKPTGDEQ